jgi:hypothetical protein
MTASNGYFATLAFAHRAFCAAASFALASALNFLLPGVSMARIIASPNTPSPVR